LLYSLNKINKLQEKQLRQKLLLQHQQDEEEDKVDGERDDIIDDNIKEDNQINTGHEVEGSSSTNFKHKISKKFYPKYNIAVDSLTKISNPRATSALNFKERRLAKVHRENVASNVVSYKEKMLVKNT
jgi:hypothetical protein